MSNLDALHKPFDQPNQEDWSINALFSKYYLSEIDNDELELKLASFSKDDRIFRLIDCFNRGRCRPLFCEENGHPH